MSERIEQLKRADWVNMIGPEYAGDDGLRASLKPCIDGLVDAGLLDSDADAAGHLFLFAQEIRRNRRGVKITVGPR